MNFRAKLVYHDISREHILGSSAFDFDAQEGASEQSLVLLKPNLNSFVIFDIGTTRFIEKLQIMAKDFNSPNIPKAISLSVSVNFIDWKAINLSWKMPQGCIDFDLFSNARFLMLSVSNEEQPILVEDISYTERSVASSELLVDHVRFGFFVGDIFYLTHSHGFFANCSLALLEIARGHPRCNLVKAINSFHFFKDLDEYDPWEDFFSPPTEGTLQELNIVQFSTPNLAHSNYESLNFSESTPLIEKFFTPSKKVSELIYGFVNKYKINYEKTISVCYRGTDKYTEIKIWPVESYWNALVPILDSNPDHRVMIQTDQEQVRDFFINKLGDRCFFLEELPVTKGERVIHEVLEESKLNFGVKLLAATIIMSRSKYLITHTGNVAYWTLLYRGSFENVVQFYV